MVANLKHAVGSKVIVEYKTDTGIIMYSKGTLVDVIDEGRMIVVESKDKDKTWYIAFSSIVVLRVDSNGFH